MGIADKSLYKDRIVDKQVEQYLRTFGAVCVEGPKWCGKTWTSSVHCNSEFLVGDPANNFQNRQLAELTPSTVLQGETPRLIDEWQEVPPIWDAVRYMVDQRGKKSQFVLTGSSTPQRKGILHSGAGRIGKIRMRTMSLYESGDSSGVVSLQDLCEGKLTPVQTGEVNLHDLIYYVVRGGWPGNIGIPVSDAQLLPQSYIEAIIEDDIYRADHVKYDSQKLWLLLRSLARNETTMATNSRLMKDIKETDDREIDRDTVAQYLDVFSRLFLIEDQPAFSSNIRSSVRIKQASKRHLCDPALACALLNASPERLLGDLNTFGFMFEAMCERDLRIYAESFDAKLFHYHDYNDNEIDAVIELPSGQWCAFEIKVGANQIEGAAQELIKIKEAIKKEKDGVPPSVLCVICGMSNAAYQRPDGVFVVPITALKD
ncbi:MAG: DUF4143 domain-containing protein [Lachnospiraceae bacterium]|nr:DUF4143 domain-containing protein [Lachnospiraceae bacterium]